MRALVCQDLIGPEGLAMTDVPAPQMASDTVLIDVHAGALNFPDLLMSRGMYQFKPTLPFVAGGEGSGTVAAVGEGVEGLSVGQPVIFMSQIGAFAEQILVPAQLVMPLPESFTASADLMNQAAGLTITYGTTLYALKNRAGLAADETLLVMGAAGGVGLAAVELGKTMGATVIAAASSDEKLAVARAAGADHLINYAGSDLRDALKAITGGRGVDVTYDPVGGSFTENAFRSMAPGGRHLVVGFAAGEIPKIPINLCLLKEASLVGVFWGAWARAKPQDNAANMRALFDMMQKGTIKPRVSKTYGLEEAVQGYHDLEERRAVGKILITPGS